MTIDLFAQNNQPPSEPKEFLPNLVGEGKKFKDLESLAKSKWESDNYIKILEQRADQMREDFITLRKEADARANLSDLVGQLQQKTQPQEPQREELREPQIDMTQIDNLISNKLDALSKAQQQKQNFDSVQAKMKQKWGGNYVNTLQEQMDQLGLTKEDINDLAQNRPGLLMKTFGLDEQQSASNNLFQSPPSTQMRSDNFRPSASNKRTWTYYQDLRKKDPLAFYDPKISVQMQKDAIELGEEFNDGDFDRDLNHPWG
jgi:hypothetical protein